MDSLADQVAIIDGSGGIVDLNAAWLRFIRVNRIPAEFSLPGKPYLDLVAAAASPGASHVVDVGRGIRTMLSGQHREFRVEYPVRASGRERWMLMRVIRLDATPDPMFVVSQFDITERRNAEDEAWRLAHHDSLTGLANRRHFDETFESEFRRNKRRRSEISLIVLDVDSFKKYNDTHGHVAGDRCLVRIAGVLSTYSRRPGDLAARLGGDEFALILGDTDYEAAGRIAQGVRRSVENLGMCFGSTGEIITVSVGAVTAMASAVDSAKDLLAAADRALYQAKSAGRNRTAHQRIAIDAKAAAVY